MATTVLKMARGKPTWGQISYFMFGSTWSFLDKAFPFSSENERETLWKSHKKEVIDLFYRDISYFPDREWRVPAASQMRPCEWWLRDAPEPRLFLDDGHTLRETDLEYLTRLGLMSDQDIEKSKTESFEKEEKARLAYREYILITPVHIAQPFPPSTPTERVGVPTEEVIPKDETVIPPSPEKPAPFEYAGECPRCGRRLKGLDSERSQCVGCGATFDCETLAKLWKSVDQFERERRAGHKVGGD